MRRSYSNFLLGRIRAATHRNVVDGQALSFTPHFFPVQELRPRINTSRCNRGILWSNAKERARSRPKAFHRARKFLSRNFVLISTCADREKYRGKFRYNAQRSSCDRVARNSVIIFNIGSASLRFFPRG